jgi:hypothetical protein
MVFIVILVMLWVNVSQYKVEPTQLVSEQAALAAIHEWENTQTAPASKIKTGIFIQSLQFFNSMEVNISGYIWQRYQDNVHDDIKPGKDEVGFIFPEQVNTGSIDPREVYRLSSGDWLVFRSYFTPTV